MFSVKESFKEYITQETLEGDNKYDAGEHGLQVTFHYLSLDIQSVVLAITVNWAILWKYKTDHVLLLYQFVY